MKKTLFAALTALCSLSATAFTTTKSEALHVWAEFPTIVADGSTVNYIKVYEHDDNGLEYTAFNMEFILPEGFVINKVKDGRREVNDIKLTERADVTHNIACNIVDGVVLRIFCDSSENANLYNDDESGTPLDHLFTIGLIAQPSLAAGEYRVRMEGVKFCLKNADACELAEEPIYFDINVTKSTGIEEIDAERLEKEECFDLQGRKVDAKAYHGIVVCKGIKYLLK